LKDNKTIISTKTYLLIWLVLGLFMTALDYYDHIIRHNQPFENYKMKWLIYSLTSLAVLFLATLLINLILKSYIKHQYIKEIISLMLGIAIFQFLGKWINKWTIPEIPLNFPFSIVPNIIMGLFYTLVYFIVHYFSYYFNRNPHTNNKRI
jgi:uncharacterized membrane protein (DUF4010 family)